MELQKVFLYQYIQKKNKTNFYPMKYYINFRFLESFLMTKK